MTISEKLLDFANRCVSGDAHLLRIAATLITELKGENEGLREARLAEIHVRHADLHELVAMQENLTSTQARCTELLLAQRASVALLRELEWSGNLPDPREGGADPCCPRCNASKTMYYGPPDYTCRAQPGKHDPRCELAQMIGAERKTA